MHQEPALAASMNVAAWGLVACVVLLEPYSPLHSQKKLCALHPHIGGVQHRPWFHAVKTLLWAATQPLHYFQLLLTAGAKNCHHQ